jgi:hypothetical protein
MTEARTIIDGESVIATISVALSLNRQFRHEQTARCVMDTINIERGDDVAAIVKTFGAQVPNPASSLTLP